MKVLFSTFDGEDIDTIEDKDLDKIIRKFTRKHDLYPDVHSRVIITIIEE